MCLNDSVLKVRIEEAKASQKKDRNAILNHIAGIDNCWHEEPPEKSEKYEVPWLGLNYSGSRNMFPGIHF